jgi:hypothetical protein
MLKDLNQRRRPLLNNGTVSTFQCQQDDATVEVFLEKKHERVKELLEAAFSFRSVPRLYTEDRNRISS